MATTRMMSDQKKTILLDIVRNSKTFFKLSELESLGSKRGIVQNTIKDILQQLVDDGLLMSEKVGVSNLYWSFGSDEVQRKSLKLNRLKSECKEAAAEIKTKKTYVEKARACKEYTEERRELEEKLKDLKGVEENQRKELELFAETDPTVYDKLIAEKASMIEECNKIIDDIFVAQEYICNKFSMEKAEFNTSFGIPQDLDYAH